MLQKDTLVKFPAYFVKYKNLTQQRRFLAEHALLWIRFQHKRGATGAIMIDIDDTILDGNQSRASHGFEYMYNLYQELFNMFPVYIVTARPDDRKREVLALLQRRGFLVPPDRLFMLPSKLYDGPIENVEKFKWEKYLEIAKAHNGGLARLGDRLWDVGTIISLKGYLKHIPEESTYIFMDPNMRGTYSAKLPGK